MQRKTKDKEVGVRKRTRLGRTASVGVHSPNSIQIRKVSFTSSLWDGVGSTARGQCELAWTPVSTRQQRSPAQPPKTERLTTNLRLTPSFRREPLCGDPGRAALQS